MVCYTLNFYTNFHAKVAHLKQLSVKLKKHCQSDHSYDLFMAFILNAQISTHEPKLCVLQQVKYGAHLNA